MKKQDGAGISIALSGARMEAFRSPCGYELYVANFGQAGVANMGQGNLISFLLFFWRCMREGWNGDTPGCLGCALEAVG
jgi:hypothetical protein